MRLHLVLAMLCACGPGKVPADGDTSTASTTASTTTGAGSTTTGAGSTTGSTTEAATTGAPTDLCPCYRPLPSLCNGGPKLGVCEAPQPCGLLSKYDQEATTCILELLRDRKWARFHYDLGWDGDHYFGEVYVRDGDGGGIRFECREAGLSLGLIPTYVALEPPDYFDGCLALFGQEARLDCLLAGLHDGESFPECLEESG